MSGPAADFRQQWANPRDILSLLLLVGGDIVQKAIAQLVGYQLHPFPGHQGRGISLTPVAFSFGWVAYGFTNLLAAVGEMSLMPSNEHSSILVTCSNGFVRENRSWVLGRFLRDHELKYLANRDTSDEDPRPISVRIDVFHLEPAQDVTCDYVWWCGWATLALQIAIAAIPWALYDEWSSMLITLCGTFLALCTCAMSQWREEKWAGRRLKSDKTMCLTRGNGSAHIIVLLARAGCWDLESAASAADAIQRRRGPRALALLLALLWTLLLISVAGLQENTWFLVVIGALGMVQNVLAAGAPRHPSASGLHLRSFERAPTIIGRRHRYIDDADAEVDLDEADAELASLKAWASSKEPRVSAFPGEKPPPTTPGFRMPSWLETMSKEDGVPAWLEPRQPDSANTNRNDEDDNKELKLRRHVTSWDSTIAARQTGRQDTIDTKKGDIVYATGVHGALIELEKWVPTAGLALVQIFFPSGLEYKDASIRDNVHKKFWQKAYHTAGVRKRAEVKRRTAERHEQGTETC